VVNPPFPDTATLSQAPAEAEVLAILELYARVYEVHQTFFPIAAVGRNGYDISDTSVEKWSIKWGV